MKKRPPLRRSSPPTLGRERSFFNTRRARTFRAGRRTGCRTSRCSGRWRCSGRRPPSQPCAAAAAACLCLCLFVSLRVCECVYLSVSVPASSAIPSEPVRPPPLRLNPAPPPADAQQADGQRSSPHRVAPDPGGVTNPNSVATQPPGPGGLRNNRPAGSAAPSRRGSRGR